MYLFAKGRVAVLLLFLFLLTNRSVAQLFFTPGYVVSTTRDTLKGELREQGNHLILFRQSGNATPRSFIPEQVKSYVADNTVRRSVRLTENGKDSTYFMYEQVSGYVSLYRLFSPEGRLTHALLLPNNTFAPLRGTLTLLTLTNNLTECNDPAFTRLLNPQSFRALNANLERIVSTYNACVRPGQVSRQPAARKRLRYEVGLSVGLARNNWVYGRSGQSNATYYDPSGSYSPTYTAAVGGFFTIAPRKRLSASVELSASWYSGSKDVPLTDPLEPAKHAYRSYAFKESYISLPITGRYVFINKRTRWYIKAGAGPTLSTRPSASYTTSDFGTTIPIEILHRTNIGIGYLVGVGANFVVGKTQPVYVEARAMPHAVLDGVTNIATSHSFQVILNVPLLKRY